MVNLTEKLLCDFLGIANIKNCINVSLMERKIVSWYEGKQYE